MLTLFPGLLKQETINLCERDKTPLLYALYGTRVYFLMFRQVIMAYECFPTFITFIALVIMVDSEMESVQGADLHIIDDINDSHEFSY